MANVRKKGKFQFEVQYTEMGQWPMFLATEPGCAEHDAAFGPLVLLFSQMKVSCAERDWPVA